MNVPVPRPLLRVSNLAVEFRVERQWLRAVNGVSFDVDLGEAIGVVGESGCGKTVTMLSILGLIPPLAGRIAGGSVEFDGKNLLTVSEAEIRKIRGKEISMIFQEPMTALNPVFTVGNQIGDVLKRHCGLSIFKARASTLELLEMVHLEEPRKLMARYPHELSGGMRQRVMIAMALACRPKLVIADEPTTSVDVTTQARLLDEIRELQKRLNMALIVVTHNLGLVAQLCRRVIVMYCGRVVEAAAVEKLFQKPLHPYTSGLLDSIPKIRKEKLPVLPTIEGMVPDLSQMTHGCAFSIRCPRAKDDCKAMTPDLTWKQGRAVACYYPNE